MRSWSLLFLFPTVAVAQILLGEPCKSKDDCLNGLDCYSNVCLNKKCIDREARALGAHFDGNAFRDQLLEEAGLTMQDLLQARLQYMGDDDGFVQSTPVQTFLDVIKSHSNELQEVAIVIEMCAAEDPEVEEETANIEGDQNQGIGKRVDNFIGSIKQLFGRGENRRLQDERELKATEAPIDSPTVSASPSVSPSVSPTMVTSASPNMVPTASPSLSLVPSVSPSLAKSSVPTATPRMAARQTPTMEPTFGLHFNAYFGFHMEAAALVGGSFSILYPSTDQWDRPSDPSRSYLRLCAGAEIGAGIAISIIGLVAYNRDSNDIIGRSIHMDLEIYDGVGVGLGLGVQLTGDMTKNGANRVVFEFTAGIGFSNALGGLSYCVMRFLEVPGTGGNSNSTTNRLLL